MITFSNTNIKYINIYHYSKQKQQTQQKSTSFFFPPNSSIFPLISIQIIKQQITNNRKQKRKSFSQSQEQSEPSLQSNQHPQNHRIQHQQEIIYRCSNERSRRANGTRKTYQNDQQNSENNQNSSQAQFIFYSGGRVSKILAQRQRQNTAQIQRLCKFHSKSYLHVQWLTDKQIEQRNIQMLRRNSRTIQSNQKRLQQIQQKYGYQHYFNPSYIKVDRILTSAVLFPIMHHKKGSEMNGKWSQMMMLVSAKLLNFQKNYIPYGVIQKDDYHPQYVDQVKIQNKVKIEHVINRVYLDKYATPQQFWKDIGQSIRTLVSSQSQTGRQQDAHTLKQCIIFLYWQWFCLSKQRFLTFLPQTSIYQKVRKDLQQQKCTINFTFNKYSPKLLQFNFDQMIKQNIFVRNNYAQIPTSQKQLLLLHPGKFSYTWLTGIDDYKDYTQTKFQYLEINDIKNLDLNIQLDNLYLIKWCDLDYDQVTWQKQSDLKCAQKIQNFKQYSKIPPKRDRQRIEQNKKYHKQILLNMLNKDSKKKQNPQQIQKYKRKLYHYNQSTKQVKQYGGQDIPVYKGYKILKNFQLEGLNWLIKSWHQKRNCILADEMGLGKTIQTIAFLNHLHVFQNVLGPFLIVAPVSTLKQWRNQIEQWSDLNCVLYKGKMDVRNLIEQYEFYHKFVTNEGIFVKFQKLPRFQVLLTNYQIFVSDIQIFQKLSFQHVILDEAHKMKNSKSRIAETLKMLPCPRILLLTGTPIQNNTVQIYGLLNVIEPRKFNSLQAFKQKFGKLKTAEQLAQLKQVLKPYLMRRVKSDVEKSIPKLSQMIVTLQLTKIQKAYYRGILQKNKNQLIASLNSTAINNISFCLRQCCDHPYLLSPQAQDEITSTCQTDQQKFDKFITASSKLIFVHKFLTKCKQNRSKTLIFTQFLEMMKLIKQYCINQKIQFQLLDGSVNYQQRQNRIDRFNNNPDILLFIISTKAGGIGINLTSATNIIIYDSDWNPQNDIQAIARAHRIGQHKNVSVYRLITTQTYQDILYKAAVKKLGIGLAILDNQYFNNQQNTQDRRKQKSKQEIQKLLKDGVLGFLKNQQGNKQQRNSIQNQSIQDIISKSCTTVDYQTKDCSFSKTKFQYEEEKDKNIDIDDPNFWEVALENVQSPLQKLVKKLKNDQQAKKIYQDLNQQLNLMLQANQVVFNFVRSKVSMSHFNAQDQRELRIFLEKITYSRQFEKRFKNIANDWLEQIEKPSRRFQKTNVNTLTQIVKSTIQNPNTRLIRNRSKKQTQQQQSNKKINNKPVTRRKNRVLQSSENSQNQNSSEQKKQISSEEDPQRNKSRNRKAVKQIKPANKNQNNKNGQLSQDNNQQDGGKNQQETQKKTRITRVLPKNPKDYKKQIVENLSFYLERICSFCQRKVCSKLCKGRCKRSFHQICYENYKQNNQQIPGTSQINELKLSKQQLCDSLSDNFQCFECILGQSKCFLCGISGKAVPSSWVERGAPKKPVRFSNQPGSRNEIEGIYQRATSEQQQSVYQCRMQYCTKTYHLKCLLETKNQLQFEIYGNKQIKSFPLKCPCHFCSCCDKMLSVTKSSCLRCPVSYHVKCKAEKSSSLYDIDNQWFICKIHMNDQDIQRRKQEKKDSIKTSGSQKRQKIEEKKFEKEAQILKQKPKQQNSKGADEIAQRLNTALKRIEQQKGGQDEESEMKDVKNKQVA